MRPPRHTNKNPIRRCGLLVGEKTFFKEMQDAGIAVRPFLEITFPQLASRINYRNHRKITVIDGK